MPVTVQAPSAANETGRPDDAVASSVKSAVPNVVSASGSNVIVCAALSMLKVCVTSLAGPWFWLPPCEAVMVQDLHR